MEKLSWTKLPNSTCTWPPYTLVSSNEGLGLLIRVMQTTYHLTLIYIDELEQYAILPLYMEVVLSRLLPTERQYSLDYFPHRSSTLYTIAHREVILLNQCPQRSSTLQTIAHREVVLSRLLPTEKQYSIYYYPQRSSTLQTIAHREVVLSRLLPTEKQYSLDYYPQRSSTLQTITHREVALSRLLPKSLGKGVLKFSQTTKGSAPSLPVFQRSIIYFFMIFESNQLIRRTSL